ncbi:helix-turn-helix domain-containing protein [Streptomyces sp. NBC_01023]|nr:helix-turn-helix domain-containing protein [Streptomyces sp. NBC_01023]
MVLLSAQGMPVAKIAEVSFTGDDRVRDVVHNFNADGFDFALSEVQGWPAQDVHAARAT